MERDMTLIGTILEAIVTKEITSPGRLYLAVHRIEVGSAGEGPTKSREAEIDFHLILLEESGHIAPGYIQFENAYRLTMKGYDLLDDFRLRGEMEKNLPTSDKDILR